MYEQQKIDNVVIRIKDHLKQENYCIDVQINQNGEVDVLTLVAVLQSLKAFEQNVIVLYFDHNSNSYCRVNDEQSHIHGNFLIKQNMIYLKIQSILSDQILANPIVESSQRKNKRNRQKSIQQAFFLVSQWRKLYRQGTFDQKGAHLKINLDQSAQILNTPRKTLEDYYLLLRKGSNLQFDFRYHKESKVGVLRGFIREKGKQIYEKKQSFDQKQFFKFLNTELAGQMILKQEQLLFNVLDEGSSDQDILFQN